MVISSDRAKFLGSKLGRKLGERLQKSRLGKRVSGLAELGSVVGGKLGQMGREKLEGKVKEYIGYYPEVKGEFNLFRQQIHQFTEQLHKN